MRFIYLPATLRIALAFPQDVRRQVISAHDKIDKPLGGEYHVSDLQVFENGEVIYAEEGTKGMGAQPERSTFKPRFILMRCGVYQSFWAGRITVPADEDISQDPSDRLFLAKIR